MENVKIERLKELVEEIADEYESIPKEILDELNEITGNGWKEEEYIEYCAEYWSSNSLDETVYALINHGQYPPCIRETIYFWNQNTDTQLSDEEISSILQKRHIENEVFNKFDFLPVEEEYKWLYDYLKDWHKSDERNIIFADNTLITCIFTQKTDFAMKKAIVFSSYSKKLIKMRCENLDEKEKKDIINFFQNKIKTIYMEK